MGTKRLKRLWLAAGLAIPVLVVGADWIAWSVLTARLRAEYAAWTRTAWSRGWVAEAARLETGGFPFAATLSLHGFSLRGGISALPSGVSWSVDDVTLALSLAHPSVLTVIPQGRQELRLSGIAPVAFTAERVVARIPLGRVRPGQTASLALDAAEVAGGLAQSIHQRDVTIAGVTLRLQAVRDAARGTRATLAVAAHGIELPDTGRWPLGATVTSLSAALDLASPPLPAGDAAEAAAAWRDGGGKLTIDALQAVWGPLVLRARGSVGLDARLQPAGEGVADLQGTAPALEALSGAGVIKPGLAATAEAVLALMAKPAPDGRGIEVPLSLAHGTLSVAKIPLMRVRDVAWRRA